MSTETKAEKSKRLKIAVITGHRRRMNLCINCGQDLHPGTECVSDYKKADNRKAIVENKIVDLERKKDTIVIYRRKKKLCARCGKELHYSKSDVDCVETYEQVDNRTEEEKNVRPATVVTPKFKPTTILDEINTFNNKEIKIQLQKTADVILQRSYIVLCINKSVTDNIVEFSCLNQLTKRYQDHIICIIGDLDKVFPYSDLMKIKKMTNIKRITNNQQEIVNYLCSCKLLLSFENDYTDYCKKNKIPVFIFEKEKNATSILKDTAYKF